MSDTEEQNAAELKKLEEEEAQDVDMKDAKGTPAKLSMEERKKKMEELRKKMVCP